jgi:hypothetical protein
MLRDFLMKELNIPAFGDDLHCVILSCGPVESMPECFGDDRMP